MCCFSVWFVGSPFHAGLKNCNVLVASSPHWQHGEVGMGCTAYLVGVVGHLHRLGMARPTAAHLWSVGWETDSECIGGERST